MHLDIRTCWKFRLLALTPEFQILLLDGMHRFLKRYSGEADDRYSVDHTLRNDASVKAHYGQLAKRTTHFLPSMPLYPWGLPSGVAFVHPHFSPRKFLLVFQDSLVVTPPMDTVLPPLSTLSFLSLFIYCILHIPFLKIILLISLFSFPSPNTTCFLNNS